jgi:hypothetical protein
MGLTFERLGAAGWFGHPRRLIQRPASTRKATWRDKVVNANRIRAVGQESPLLRLQCFVYFWS